MLSTTAVLLVSTAPVLPKPVGIFVNIADVPPVGSAEIPIKYFPGGKTIPAGTFMGTCV